MFLEWDLGGKGVIQANRALGRPQFKQKRPPVVHYPEGPAGAAHSLADSSPPPPHPVRCLFCGAVLKAS